MNNVRTAGLSLRASTACPSCDVRHVVDLRQTLEAKPPGTYSLSGAQTKVAATESWSYVCTNCGASGKAVAPAPTSVLAALPLGVCGHVVATNHYGGNDHLGENCPGCCPACQKTKDAAKGIR